MSIPSCSMSFSVVLLTFPAFRSVNCIFAKSTPFSYNILAISIVWAITLFSCRGIRPNSLAISFSCSEILHFFFPLYASLSIATCCPYLKFPSSLCFSIIRCIFTPSCSISFNNIFFWRLPTIFDNCIFSNLTPSLFNMLAILRISDIALSFSIPSTVSSNSTKSFNNPVSSKGPAFLSVKPLPRLSPSFAILSCKSICHKSTWLPSLIISCTSSICFSFNPSNSFFKYSLYLFCISFNTVAYPVSSLSLLFISGNVPLCLSVQSSIRFSICISSCSVISFSQFTFNVLFTKSITTGLFSSLVGLSGSSA